jgi:formate hydrogenlyase transcriptional activator
VAKAIHEQSHRKEGVFVKINCAAIPFHLLESELFGHEKGAFTGAVERKIGKFELANGGTLFLDEIGDMPHELQAKLLRVLQEKSFERVGGNKTIKTNVRIITATHCNLEKLIEAGAFRQDLYYRLQVFPIQIPALRERKEDIPVLVEHFVNHFAKTLNKQLLGVSQQVLDV